MENDDTTELDRYFEDFKVADHNNIKPLLGQIGGLLSRANQLHADADRDHAIAKDNRETTEANLFILLKASLLAEHGKATEKTIDAHVQLHPEFALVKETEIDAEHARVSAKGVVNALINCNDSGRSLSGLLRDELKTKVYIPDEDDL